MQAHDIIVVGASAGGIEAMRELVAGLRVDLKAAVFVVVHMPSDSRSILPELLSRAGPLPAAHPEDEDPIEHGRIYVGPPDHHLLIEEDRVRIVRGPRHNRMRPAIDPLFRSAAHAYASRVVGVILSGTLDDGSAGLEAIKRHGGVAVVQSPDTAMFASMPRSAMASVAVDHVVPVSEMGELLHRLSKQEASVAPAAPNTELNEELKAYLGRRVNMERIGKPSVFACPECNGVLWEVDEGGVLQFHCRVGHTFSAEGLISEQDSSLEASLWAAVRALEENAGLRKRVAERMRKQSPGDAGLIEARVAVSEYHAAQIRSLLTRDQPDEDDPDS